MKDTFLQIAGVRSEKEFYAKYPTEEAFFSAHPEAMQMKHGGAVDLNAFYNQPRFVQTNIFREGGVLDEFLPEFQWAGPTDPSMVMLPDQQKIWRQNQDMWGTDPNQTIKVPDNEAGQTNFTGAPPTGGAPAFTPNTNPASKPAAQTTPPAAANTATNPAANTANTTSTPQKGTTSMWQPVAEHQVFGDKTYRKLSNNAMMPLYNPAIGMLSDNGLAGYLKMGIGAMAGISGMATGLDNVWRGFKGRKQETAPVVPKKPEDYKTPEMMQESPMQEMQRKQQNQINPPIINSPVNPVSSPAIDYSNTAMYGGDLYQAANGVDFTKNPAIDPSKVQIGPTEAVVDLQGGLNRTLGANMGMSMFNNALGFKQGMKAVRENSIKAGMTDYGYQPDDTNWMPMGYDTLNTGPGQTQAPNLYTPVQYAGAQMASQYEEGGEYDLTEEEIQQILAAGGEVEFM